MENVCKEMLEFRIHKDKFGINRFSQETPKTIQTLKNLKTKGVTVSIFEILKFFEFWLKE